VRTMFPAGQVYGDAVLLGADTTLAADNAGVIRFATTLDGSFALAANTQGTTTFGGAVGGTTALVSLTTDLGGETVVAGGLVRTSGDQTYGDLLSFEPVLAEEDVFQLAVLLADEDDDSSLNSDSSSDFGPAPQTLLEGATVRADQGIDGGGHGLVIVGDAVFGDQPGSLIPDEIADAVDPVRNLGGLRVTGTTTVNSTLIQTTGLQTYEAAVTLGSDVLFQALEVWFETTVTGPGRTLAIYATLGGVLFGGDVGTSAAPLGPITAIGFMGVIQIDAAIHSTGPVLLASVFGGIDGGPLNAIYVPAGDLTLVGLGGVGVTNPIAVEAATVAAISTVGDIRLRGIGDLVVGTPGLIAGGTIDLDAGGEIRVPGGRTIQAGQRVTTTKPIRWGLLGTADSGPGALRDVIGKANATGAPGIVEFGPARATFKLQSQLPDISTSLVLDGGGRVTIDGNRRAAHGLSFVAGSAGSELRGVAVRNFTNFGIRLLDSPGVTVAGVTVASINTATSMGLYATGNLTGTTIVSSLFTGGLRGALLVNARNLAFGAIGQGNTFTGNRSVPGSQFAGTGIRAQGNCAGTVVEGNTFTQNNYGFAFINARNLRLSRNVFTRNTIAGILIEGNNQGSVSTGNTFGKGTQKNGRDVQRVRGAQGL
jgi:hypothetical protein